MNPSSGPAPQLYEVQRRRPDGSWGESTYHAQLPQATGEYRVAPVDLLRGDTLDFFARLTEPVVEVAMRLREASGRKFPPWGHLNDDDRRPWLEQAREELSKGETNGFEKK